MKIPTHLTPSSTVADLPLHDCKVDSDTLGEVVAEQFERHPTLPGVIVVDHYQLLGIISRQSFQRRMMKPFALEIFLKRPLKIFFGLDEQPEAQDYLQLLYTERIVDVVPMVLSRPVERLYEPILVVFQNDSLPDVKAYFLLDCQTLITAQSQILLVANQQIHHQKQKLRSYLAKLEAEQKRSKDYAYMLEEQQGMIQERNQLLENQQKELVQRSREVAELNQRFMQIGQLLSMEGKKAFQATFAGVNAICRSTNQIVNVGQSLNHELGTIHEASQVIANVSKQVQYLAIKAGGIGANQSVAQTSGFSTITSEISNLVTQTFEAGRQMDRIASRFKQRIQELTEAAQAGTSTARSLVTKIQQAQVALAELEALIYQQDVVPTHPSQDADSAQAVNSSEAEHLHLSPVQMNTSTVLQTNVDAAEPWLRGNETQTLVQRIIRAETMLSELKELVSHGDQGSVGQTDGELLLTKIKRTLELHQQQSAS
jgi:hypothetical protein